MSDRLREAARAYLAEGLAPPGEAPTAANPFTLPAPGAGDTSMPLENKERSVYTDDAPLAAEALRSEVTTSGDASTSEFGGGSLDPRAPSYTPGALPGRRPRQMAGTEVDLSKMVPENFRRIQGNEATIQQSMADVGQAAAEEHKNITAWAEAQYADKKDRVGKMSAHRADALLRNQQQMELMRTQARTASKDLHDRGKFWKNPFNVMSALFTALMPLGGRIDAAHASKMIDDAVKADWEQRKQIADHDATGLMSNASMYRQVAADQAQADQLGLMESHAMATEQLKVMGQKYKSKTAQDRLTGILAQRDKEAALMDRKFWQESMVAPHIRGRGETALSKAGLLDRAAAPAGVPSADPRVLRDATGAPAEPVQVPGYTGTAVPGAPAPPRRVSRKPKVGRLTQAARRGVGSIMGAPGHRVSVGPHAAAPLAGAPSAPDPLGALKGTSTLSQIARATKDVVAKHGDYDPRTHAGKVGVHRTNDGTFAGIGIPTPGGGVKTENLPVLSNKQAADMEKYYPGGSRLYKQELENIGKRMYSGSKALLDAIEQKHRAAIADRKIGSNGRPGLSTSERTDLFLKGIPGGGKDGKGGLPGMIALRSKYLGNFRTQAEELQKHFYKDHVKDVLPQENLKGLVRLQANIKTFSDSAKAHGFNPEHFRPNAEGALGGSGYAEVRRRFGTIFGQSAENFVFAGGGGKNEREGYIKYKILSQRIREHFARETKQLVGAAAGKDEMAVVLDILSPNSNLDEMYRYIGGQTDREASKVDGLMSAYGKGLPYIFMRYKWGKDLQGAGFNIGRLRGGGRGLVKPRDE